ncbi:MAG: hypothetical protein DPW11_00490 [bacterium]|nr:hypothetical protein [bacterium]RIK52074.1 MAG: hypothetical protein DCC61_00695 [Candidatus Microgenomates bacterium]
MKRKEPLVSVVMPVYNAGEFVGQAIESIINQTYTNWELIIIDDASTDNTWKIVSNFAKKYTKKIRAYRLRNNRNAGGDIAGNIGFAKARGAYIARMDGDDVALPTRLATQVAFLEKNKRVDIVGSNAIVIDREGREVGQKRVPIKHSEIEREFFTFHPMIHPSVMVRASSVNPKSFYRIEYLANNDYLTFFTYLTSGKVFANIATPLLFYRIHGHNDSLAHVRRNFINLLKIRMKAIKDMGYRPSVISILKLMVQAMLVMLLPERLTVELYYLVRGIKRWQDYALYPESLELARMKAYAQAVVGSIFISSR